MLVYHVNGSASIGYTAFTLLPFHFHWRLRLKAHNEWGTLLTREIINQTGKYYRNDPKFSDIYALANSADPDQSDLGLHCLLFRLHRLDSLLYGRAK